MFAMSFCLLLINSCNTNPKNSSKFETLYIKTTTAKGSGKDMIKSESISQISTDYFEVTLESLSSGGFMADKDIIEPRIGEPFYMVSFQISQKDGTDIVFLTSTDFLNFMSTHGYNLVNQIPNEYGGDYTFKRK